MLTRRERQVVVLRYYTDVSEVDVADLLGISVGTVKRTASQGLATALLQVLAAAMVHRQPKVWEPGNPPTAGGFSANLATAALFAMALPHRCRHPRRQLPAAVHPLAHAVPAAGAGEAG